MDNTFSEMRQWFRENNIKASDLKQMRHNEKRLTWNAEVVTNCICIALCLLILAKLLGG